MTLLKQVSLMLLGAALILGLVLLWKYTTGMISQVVERALCWMSGQSATCTLRAYARFSVWMAVGIVNLLVIGGILDKLNASGRPR
jgi:hypothetical protein